VVALKKRRIAAADARGLAMIVDPGLDEAYFLAADEVSFEQELELGATIYVEEDYSLEAAPRELRDEYEAAQLSGDKDRVEAILTELWEEYGIDPEKDPDQRATGGIRKLVVTDDHFAHVVRVRAQQGGSDCLA